MNNTATLSVQGKSGTSYTFYIYSLPPNLKAEGGVYLFTELLSNGSYKYIYLGITENLSERFDSHHKADCIADNGATHLCAFLQNNETSRRAIEKDILGAIKTTCNEVLN